MTSVLVQVFSRLRIMCFLYVPYKVWGDVRTPRGLKLAFFPCLLCWFFLPRPIISIFRCESSWCFYFPLNAFPRNVSLQEVRYFVGVDWNPQGVPSHVLLFMMLLFVISVVFFLLFLWHCALCAWVLFPTRANCIYLTFMCCVAFLLIIIFISPMMV